MPPNYVEIGFEIIKRDSCELFKPIIDYLEEWYIGQPVKGNKRKIPAFPITAWNVNKKTLEGLPRTQNNQEAWHGSEFIFFYFFIYNVSYVNVSPMIGY